MINNLIDNSLVGLFSDEPLEPRGVSGFFCRLWGMMKLRGWRKRDSLILLATMVVHLILAPVRFTLLIFHSLFGNMTPDNKQGGWEKWLDKIGYTPLFDCVVVSNYGVFRLRHKVHNLALVCLKHEPPVREVFQPREGEVVIDVGTHIGSYTIPASRSVGSQGRVIAIEAEPSNFNDLVFNLELNQANNVTSLNLAAWDREAMLDLHISEDITSHSLVSLPYGLSKVVKKRSSAPPLQQPPKSIKVKARPLDAVLEELGIEVVDWIKIDVQGAEVEVLKGLEKTMSRSPNLKLIIEVHSNETTEKCLSILKESGYGVRWVTNQHLFASP